MYSVIERVESNVAGTGIDLSVIHVNAGEIEDGMFDDDTVRDEYPQIKFALNPCRQMTGLWVTKQEFSRFQTISLERLQHDRA
jgi:hypothetical protein